MPETDMKAADVIHAYRKRRERLVPLLLGGLAIVLLVVGVFMIIMWLSGDKAPQLPAIFASDTPTPTETATPQKPTATPTITLTPEPSQTPTPSGPVTYIVELGDTLWTIAAKFGIDDIRLIMSANDLADPDAIFVGDELIIPEEGAELPTETALPATMTVGQKIEYRVLPGDTLESIASKFNSTAEAIAKENEIEDPNTIGVGQLIIIPVYIATPTPTIES
jgi:LysM repeat protein